MGQDDARHLGAVLRLRAGEPVSATDGRGGLRSFVWDGAGGLEPAGEIDTEPRPDPPVTVAFAPVKGDRPEWAVQKLTELGVDRIVLLRADRSVVRWDGEREAGHLARLHKVAVQAVMQSRRRWLPALELMWFGDLAAGGQAPGVGLAEPGGHPPTLALPTLMVGPEGGWSPEELSCGLPLVGLGPGVLRSETAAVAAGVLLCALRAGVVSSPR